MSRESQGGVQTANVAITATSEQKPNPADALRIPVAVTARALKPFAPVAREDLAIENLHIAPPGRFSKVEDVLARTAWSD